MTLFGSFLLDIIVAVTLLLVVAYVYGTSTYGYFKKRGIPFVPPLPFIGNIGGVLTGRHTLNTIVEPLYEHLKKHRFGGIFMSRDPVVMLCDPELIKIAFTKDFSSFHDHGVAYDEKNDPMSVNLFNIPGIRWKNLRNKLSPVFTSGKLKQMFPLMRECSADLSNVLREKSLKGDSVELREFLIRYATDVIGSCAFGINCHSLRDPKSEFYVISRRFFQPSLLISLRFSLLPNSKILSKLFPIKRMFPNLHEFYGNLMAETINYRKTEQVQRNDFVQLMMQLQENDEGKTEETHPDEVIVTDLVIAAQAVFFFIAGLDGIANTVGFALHHLSIDTRTQDDLADEIRSVMNQYEGKITYEGLKEMKLLEMTVLESLRMYSPAGVLFREVTAPLYTIPGSNFTMNKGMKVAVPVRGLHYDPDIYPDPERFDPYRFSEEAAFKRHPYTFLPFGEGPRVCIATRFALLEIKLCLASLLSDYKFSVCSDTQIPIKLRAFTTTISPAKGFFLKIDQRTE